MDPGAMSAVIEWAATWESCGWEWNAALQPSAAFITPPISLAPLVLHMGHLAEDPVEQSSLFSLVLAAEIPAHLFWARLGFPEPREAAEGAV